MNKDSILYQEWCDYVSIRINLFEQILFPIFIHDKEFAIQNIMSFKAQSKGGNNNNNILAAATETFTFPNRSDDDNDKVVSDESDEKKLNLIDVPTKASATANPTLKSTLDTTPYSSEPQYVQLAQPRDRRSMNPSPTSPHVLRPKTDMASLTSDDSTSTSNSMVKRECKQADIDTSGESDRVELIEIV